jgi:hypothetical protein
MEQNDKDKLRNILRGLEEIPSNDQEENHLAEFWEDLTGGFKFNSLDERFDAIAHYLMNYLYLSVANEAYRITELEIYYHDKENHPDPYVHCSKEQLTPGNWYFNGAGLDITFGNIEKGIYAGILLRGIRKICESPYYISGPSNVLKEIFSNMGNVLFDEGGICLKELEQETISQFEMVPFRSNRIGLTKQKDDIENYIDKNYRFLVDRNILHKFKDKERVVRQLLAENKISNEQANEMMGYEIKS